MTARFVIEGTWNGRVVHRSSHPASSKELRDWAEKTSAIKWKSGAKLELAVRDLKDGEQEDVIDHFSSLISECATYDVDSLDALIAAERVA